LQQGLCLDRLASAARVGVYHARTGVYGHLLLNPGLNSNGTVYFFGWCVSVND